MGTEVVVVAACWPRPETTNARHSCGAAPPFLALGYAPLAEVSLPNGRRADLMALGPRGEIAIAEVKSGLDDYRTDRKWAEYAPLLRRLLLRCRRGFPAPHPGRRAGLDRRGRFWRRRAGRAAGRPARARAAKGADADVCAPRRRPRPRARVVASTRRARLARIRQVGAPVHAQAPRGLRDVVAAGAIDALDVFPAPTRSADIGFSGGLGGLVVAGEQGAQHIIGVSGLER